ncbi:MAG: Gfo/Idh/MocA family oxidoreductase, partial [Clostridia bacterium]|nr:Gfo/Idh/MocA family oxidoreductase [Clostridia bacterium]
MENIRLGLIGCGSMMEAHASNINKVDGIEITVVCDIVREHAERVAKALGNDPKIVLDYRTMLDDVDAILVALPHDLHYECGMYFARHKKHILMEKPLCNTEEEC